MSDAGLSVLVEDDDLRVEVRDASDPAVSLFTKSDTDTVSLIAEADDGKEINTRLDLDADDARTLGKELLDAADDAENEDWDTEWGFEP